MSYFGDFNHKKILKWDLIEKYFGSENGSKNLFLLTTNSSDKFTTTNIFNLDDLGYAYIFIDERFRF